MWPNRHTAQTGGTAFPARGLMSGESPHRDQRGRLKTAPLPIRVVPEATRRLRKPGWIKAKPPFGPRVHRLKTLLREQGLHTVCEEAACPNLGECFSGGTATFMIMGDICTRRCPFCSVAHGRPKPLDEEEPGHLAEAVARMGLNYVVMTSVDRDDLPDGGAGHFVACIRALRAQSPALRVEILVPDFRHKIDRALNVLRAGLPDVFNHNLETIPRLYPRVRPVADYSASLSLLQKFKQQHPEVPSKSGLMLGLGEDLEEVREVLRDLRAHQCDMLTLGQYLQPSSYHLPVERFVSPDEFAELGRFAEQLGFDHVASAPMVRSSYHAEQQISHQPI